MFLLFFILILFSSFAIAIDVNVVSEKHNLISHEIILEVTNSQGQDKLKSWDFNISNILDREILNPEYFLQEINEEIVYETVSTTVDCDSKRISCFDIDSNSELSCACFSKNNPKNFEDGFLYTINRPWFRR